MWHRLAIKNMPAVSFQCDGQKSCILGQLSFSLFLALAFLLLPSHCLICIFGPFVWLHCLIHLNVPPAHPSRFDTFYKHLLKGLSQTSNWHHYPLIHPKRKRLLLQSAHGRKKNKWDIWCRFSCAAWVLHLVLMLCFRATVSHGSVCVHKWCAVWFLLIANLNIWLAPHRSNLCLSVVILSSWFMDMFIHIWRRKYADCMRDV